MEQEETLTAKTVLDYAIARIKTEPSILVLRLKLDVGIANVALDRRMSERLSKDLAKIAKKLSAPQHEN